jgi:hypothetical protein
MRRARIWLMAALLVLAACGDDDDDGAPPTDAGADAAADGAADAAADAAPTTCWPVHEDDPPAPEPLDCPPARANGGPDLLAAARATAGLPGPLAWTEDDLAQADYAQVLPNDYILPGYAETHDAPETSVCFANDLAGNVDRAAGSLHALSGTIAEAAARLGVPLGVSDEPTPDPAVCGAPLANAALSFARAAGDDPDEEAVREDAADVPADLQGALAAILHAMEAVVSARADAVEYFGQIDAEDVAVNAPDLTGVSSQAAASWITSRGLQDELRGPWRAALFGAARDLAVQIDHARPLLARGGFGEGFSFSLDTRHGRIVVHDDASDTTTADLDPIALLVDTGGDDVYDNAAGATVWPRGELLTIPVAVLIDAGGRDRYGYEEFPSEYDGVAHRAPADLWGRRDAGPGPYCVTEGGQQFYGPITVSREVRQGAGIFGVGMLVDLGGGDDEYTSLRRSQGYGAAGVGLLFDDGGADLYAGESEVQGAATMGLGLLVDLGEQPDEHVAYVQSQGFAYVGGVGALWDGGGDDSYVCDHGIPAEGGDPIYCSPQRAGGDGNSSFCQGAGFGLRGDSRDPPTFLAGGLGLLRDASGADTYEASVFAQGTGYWQGIGILSDGDGDDVYDAIWYVQGGAAHYAVGMLVDGGGADRYDDREWTVGVALGTGHDYSLGVLVDESGDDRYFGAGNALGDGNCNGIGLLVDNAGDDTWRSTTRDSLGHAHLSGECVRREGALTGAVFIDAAGDDTYERPAGDPTAADDAAFAQNAGYEGELGAFLDASEGDSRVHALP